MKKRKPIDIEVEIIKFLRWLRIPPKTKAEKRDKYMTMLFITINVLSAIGVVISYIGSMKGV